MINKGPSSNRPRKSGRTVTTRSGRQLKVNSSLGERWNAMRAAKSRRKVDRLIGLPKSRVKRIIWKMHPKRLAAFWFSRDGAIMALKIAGIAIVFMFIFTLAIFAYFRKDLPDIKDISGGNLGGSISYYDRTGQTLLWQDYDAVKRVPVQGTQMSQYIKDATVAVEDKDFYQHRGFDVKGISRAAYNDVKGGSRQGGSTITQQLVKLTQDWTEQRTFTRKVKELILAVELERSYTKDEILTGYLNAAPYGSVDYGVQAAASDYFHKSAKDLTLAESAFLASIPKSPAIYSPYSDKEYFEQEALLSRSRYVLDQMVATGKITKQQAEEAKKIDVLATVQPQQTKYAGIRAPYFLLAAKKELKERFLPSDGNGSTKVGGWKVVTTIDLKLQGMAEEQVQKGLAQVKRQGGDVAAFAAEDVHTGQMVALVGGVDFTNKEYGEINYAQTNLPPGSSFKPYDYTALIEHSNNTGAGSVLYDSQGAIGTAYPCTDKTRPTPRGDNSKKCLWDYDFRFPGPMTLRYALGGSRNVPAVKAMMINGIDKTIKTAESLGLKSGYNCYADEQLKEEGPCYASSAIGDGAYLHLDEHVHGYASLSRMGNNIPQTYILKIFNAKSNTKPFYEWKQQKGTQAVRKDSAYIVANMMQDPSASYFPAGRKPHRYNGWNFAMKTGTTNDAKDGWMMGFSTQYAAGVWVGYHTRQKEMSGTMENMTQPIWQGWMQAAHKDIKAVNWTEPSDIQHLPAYVVRSHVGIGSVEPSPATEIYPSWYKPPSATVQNATIDKVSNKLATDCTPSLAKQNVGGNNTADFFSIDIYFGAKAASSGNANTTVNDDVHQCSDAKPSIASFYVNGQDVSDGGSATCTDSCTITTTVVAGTHPFNDPQYAQNPGTVNLLVNGQVADTKQVSDSPSTVSFTYSGSGSVTIAVQVIDSVLYDATSGSATVNFQGAGTTPLTITGATAGAATTTISWSGGTGSYSVYKGTTVICSTSNNTCQVARTTAPPGTSLTVKDSAGNTSPAKTVT